MASVMAATCAAHLGGVVTREIDLALGLLQQAQRVGLVAQALPGDVASRRRHDRLGLGAKGRQGDPVEQVQPQLQVVELAQGVVAEQVGVGGHDHPALAVTHGGEQAGAGGWAVGAGPQHERAVALGSAARPRGRSRLCARRCSRPALVGAGDRPRRTTHIGVPLWRA